MVDLRCPHCGEPLAPGERAFTCPQGHSFDRARQGYVNLLRQTRAHGDSAAMLQARRRFLDAGHYASLAAAVTETLAAWLAGAGERLAPSARALVDCGCGEGYYLDCLAATLGNDLRARSWRLYGFDLARDAVRMAGSRRYGVDGGERGIGAALVAASMWDRLPFADAGVGVALVIFAPRNAAELARVVAPGGLLLVVTPAPDHLAEARAALPALLSPQPEKAARLRAALAPAFLPVSERAARFPLNLDGPALADLAAMTPHRATPGAAAASASDLTEQARAVADAAPGRLFAVTAACALTAFARA